MDFDGTYRQDEKGHVSAFVGLRRKSQFHCQRRRTRSRRPSPVRFYQFGPGRGERGRGGRAANIVREKEQKEEERRGSGGHGARIGGGDVVGAGFVQRCGTPSAVCAQQSVPLQRDSGAVGSFDGEI